MDVNLSVFTFSLQPLRNMDEVLPLSCLSFLHAKFTRQKMHAFLPCELSGIELIDIRPKKSISGAYFYGTNTLTPIRSFLALDPLFG